MLSGKRTIVLVLIVGLIVGWMTPLGQARPALTPQDLVREMRRHFVALTDYQCVMVNTKLKKGQPSSEANHYYFKKPKLIRLEVMNGHDKGAVCVLTPSGKVRAHAGGILGIITITMEPNDKRLQDDDGSTFVESHLGGTIKDIEDTIARGNATLGETAGSSGKLYQIKIDRGGKQDLILIDPKTFMPIEWTTEAGGQLENKTEWKELRVDIGLSDSLFSL